MGGRGTPVYEFGPFRLDVAERLLLRGGEPLPLTPKGFDLLLVLVENHGHLIPKNELLRRVWSGSFVEEAVLSVNISLLRKTLCDGHTGDDYIKTIPKQGYRFAAAVRELPANSEPIAAIGGNGREGVLEPVRPRHAARVVIVGVIAAASLALAAYWLGAPGDQPPRRVMLAVLPFENLSGDAEQEYLSDGLTEEMITQLAHVNPEALGVIARTSAMQYKRTQKSTVQIGRELRVDYILEGSIRRAGERVRISAQLVRVRDQTHRWADNYDQDVRDVLTLQDDVAKAIAGEISLKLTPRSQVRLARSRAVVPKAREFYLKGRYFWNKRTEEGLKRAAEYFQQAIEQDAGYALPYAGLADTYILLGYYSIIPPRDAYPKAERAALKAIEMDETLGEAHSSLAGILMDYRWAWADVEREYKRALQLSPGYAVAHQWYGNYLSAMGRSQEAIRETLRARELDPLSLIININVAWAYHLARDDDKAIQEARRILEMDPGFYATHLVLGRAYEAKGMHTEAIAAFERAVTLSEGNSMVLSELGHAYASAGRRSDAQRILAQLREPKAGGYGSPYDIALVYVGLGQNDEALDWLEKSYEERARALGFARVEPRLDPLRSDTRFIHLLQRMGLASDR